MISQSSFMQKTGQLIFLLYKLTSMRSWMYPTLFYAFLQLQISNTGTIFLIRSAVSLFSISMMCLIIIANKIYSFEDEIILQSSEPIYQLNKVIIICNQIKNQMHEKFIGQSKQQHYTVVKTYLDTEEKQVRLYHTKFTPPNPTKTICIIHGFGQHSGRFYPIADYFAKKDFEVLLVDLRGFGYSGAPRGCATIEKLENDVILLLRQAKEDLPLYIYAHSLGGLVTCKLLLERPSLNITGVILTSPLFGFPKDRKLPWLKIFMLKQIGGGMEDVIVNSMVNPTALTKNNKFIQTIFEDRLMIPFLSLNMGKSIFEAIDYFNKHLDSFRFPVIVFHGKHDSVTSYHDSQRFVYGKVAAYKKLHLFEAGYHELQHDQEKDELLQTGHKFLSELPSYLVKPLGKVNVENIDTRLRPKHFFRNLLIAIVLIVVLFKVLKSKGKTGIPLLARILLAVRGVKTAKN